MRLWIQRADLSSEPERDMQTPKAAMDAYHAFDWAAELRRLNALEKSESDYCPPGMGLMRADGSILHVCPDHQNNLMVHWHRPPERRVFGLFKRHALPLTTSVPVSKLQQLINPYFSKDDLSLALTLEANSP